MTSTKQHVGDAVIDIDRYVRAIHRGAGAIVAGALVGALAAFGYASTRPTLYRGVTTLLVVPPAQPAGPQMNPATFRAIVENQTLASEVIAELNLSGQITPQRFLEDALTVEEVRDTNIVKVNVTLENPQTAAEASRKLAAKAIVLTQQIYELNGESIQRQLKAHLVEAEKRRSRAEEALLTFKQGAQVDALKEDATAQLKERSDLLRLVIDIEAEKARLAAAETEIQRQSPLLEAGRLTGAEDALRRASVDPKAARPSGDPQTGAASSAARGEADPRFLDLSNRFINPVYQTLDFQIATSRTRIAALEKQRDELVTVRKIGGKELALLTELYRREIVQARLEANLDLAARAHSDLALRYEQSRTQPLGSSGQLQVIDEALPPERPESRRRAQYAMFGAAAGVVVMLCLIVAWEARIRRP